MKAKPRKAPLSLPNTKQPTCYQPSVTLGVPPSPREVSGPAAVPPAQVCAALLLPGGKASCNKTQGII